MEQFSQSGSRGRRRTGNEPAPHERVKGERRANEPRRTASPHRASANNAGRANTPAAEQTPARPKSRYIPALDGLRTLAVVAVVLYHLNLTWAQGGLLGVTIDVLSSDHACCSTKSLRPAASTLRASGFAAYPDHALAAQRSR